MTRTVSIGRIKAREILRLLSITTPEDLVVEDIAWVRGALVVDGPLEGVEGRLIRGEHKSIITVKSDLREIGRHRFVVAHELGHLELHAARTQLALCTASDIDTYSYKSSNEEADANEFAGELLLPEPMVKPRFEGQQPSLLLIASVAEEFRCSLTATAIRFIQSCDDRCAVVMSRDNVVEWCWAADDFGYRIERGMRLHRDSYAADFFSGKTLPGGMNDVPAGAWLTGSDIAANSRIMEHSRAFTTYGAVLTLLWIKDGIDAESRLDEEDESDSDSSFTPDGKRWRW